MCITAVAERGAAAEEQNASTTPVGEFPDKPLLLGIEVTRFHASDNQTVVCKQVFYFRGETIFQLLGVLDSLAIDLVLRGPHHRNQFEAAIILHGAPEKLVLPARFAFNVQDVRL